jgi:post-segregation antitoxin (ccd killing protein)
MGKPKSILVDADLLNEAVDLGVDVRELVESALRHRVEAEQRAARWAEENRSFVESYNQHIEKHGTFGEAYRRYG